MVLTDYTYIFAIGTMFALLEAFNNGASMFSPKTPCTVPNSIWANEGKNTLTSLLSSR